MTHPPWLWAVFTIIAAAARSGLSLVWKIVLVAELLGRPNGVGFEIGTAFQLFDITRILAYALAFAAVVLVGHAAGVSTPVTAGAAATFFGARVAHAVVHVAGVSRLMARTMIFVVAWGAFVAYAVEVLRRAG